MIYKKNDLNHKATTEYHQVFYIIQKYASKVYSIVNYL